MAIRNFASVSGSIRECEPIPQDKEALRQTLRNHLKEIFPHLNIMAQDYLVGVANFNTLAYDTNRQKFVIVEYIRGENGLASRVIEYDDELKKSVHQNAILELYMNRRGKGEALTNWPGAYVIAMSDHFSDRDKELAPKGKFSLPTELHTVTIHRAHIMEIESIDNVHTEKTSAPPSKTKARRTKRGRPAKNTMEFFLSKRDKKVREIGLALAADLEKMHLKPNFIESNQYAYFTLDSMKVCGIKVLRDKLRIIYAVTENADLDKSEFVYNIKRDQLGGYASDIKTNADMSRALHIVKDICGIKKAPKSPNANENYDLKHTFFIKGKQFQAKASIDALRQIIDYMAETDPQFIQRLPESKKSFISQKKFARHYKIKAAPGWYLDVNLSVAKIKKVAGLIRKASSPQIRDTMSGDIFGGRGETTESKEQKPNASNVEFKFRIEGLEFQADSAIGAVKKIITYLARVDLQFLKRIESLHHGKTRKYIARDKNALYPGRPDLQKFSFEIPTAPGWYLGTNYNVIILKKIAALSKEAAEPKIRDTMVGKNMFSYA